MNIIDKKGFPIFTIKIKPLSKNHKKDKITYMRE